MPTIAHEAPIELLRRNPMLAVELLRDVPGLDLPGNADATLGCTDLSNVIPAQFLADMVITVKGGPGKGPVLAVVVESQLRNPEEKEFSWPVYLTTARKLNQCEALLLVICPDTGQADACRRVIRTGHPGFDLRPIVIDPSTTPDPAGPGSPEMTVFAACMGTIDLEHEAGQHHVLNAVRDLDTEQRRAYTTLILAVASDAARHALEAMMTTFSYKSDFIEGFVEEGIAKGKAEGLLKVLGSRGIRLTGKQSDLVQTCHDLEQLDLWFDRALTANTAKDVFRD